MSESQATTPTAIWQQQSVWSQTANRLKQNIERTRAIALGLTIAGAALATLATQVTTLSSAAGKGLALAAALAIALVPLLRRRIGPDVVRDWTRIRSVSEALKSEVYTFLAGVAPYRGADHQQLLQDRVDALMQDADDLIQHTLCVTAVPRQLPDLRDVDSYVRERVTRQIDDYYRPRAATLERQLTWLRRAEFGLTVVGIALGAAAATLQVAQAAAWVAVVTTVTAALTAHAAASRLEFQMVEFLRTAAELTRLRRQRDRYGQKGAAGDDEFVQRCEHVISVENEAWMAKLTSASDGPS